MIVIDVETTSLDTRNGSIVSLGAVDLNEPTNQFYDECRVWEGADINDEALAVNGFSREEITASTKKSEAELIAAFVAWATDRPKVRMLAAQNVSFDLEYVQAACERAGLDCPFGKRTIDVHTLTWLHMVGRGIEPPTNEHGNSRISLDAALKYCGLEEEPDPHNALTGALCHAEVISRIAYNRSIIPDFSSFPIPWQT